MVIKLQKTARIIILSLSAALLCAGAACAAAQPDLDAQIKQQEREFEKIQKQISQNQKRLSEASK